MILDIHVVSIYKYGTRPSEGPDTEVLDTVCRMYLKARRHAKQDMLLRTRDGGLVAHYITMDEQTAQQFADAVPAKSMELLPKSSGTLEAVVTNVKFEIGLKVYAIPLTSNN